MRYNSKDLNLASKKPFRNFGCKKCIQRGLHIRARIIFPLSNARTGTGGEFRQSNFQSDRVESSPFLKIPTDMLQMFPKLPTLCLLRPNPQTFCRLDERQRKLLSQQICQGGTRWMHCTIPYDFQVLRCHTRDRTLGSCRASQVSFICFVYVPLTYVVISHFCLIPYAYSVTLRCILGIVLQNSCYSVCPTSDHTVRVTRNFI